jgi:predicted DNA-binding transcriptional regulator YafY
MEILKHGSGVEVIKPKELREMVKTEAEKIGRLYEN